MVYYINKYYQGTDVYVGPWTVYIQFEDEVAFQYIVDEDYELDPDSFKANGDYWEMKANRDDYTLTLRMGKLGGYYIMSLSVDFIYDGTEYDVSNRVVFGYFSELHPDREEPSIIECEVTLEQLLNLHKMLCDTLHKEQMDLDLEYPTVWEEAISPVKGAIKTMKQNPDLVVWYS